MDDLTELANRFGSDKGDQHFDKHHYTRIYSALFSKIRQRPVRFLEIGLLHVADPGWIVPRNYEGTAAANRAPSMSMWSSYFPNGQIFGFDINDFRAVELDRCQIFRGDMSSKTDLEEFVRTSEGSFDIIIDDASHTSHHQQIALGALFPHLRAGGIYVIEDLHWPPAEIELEKVVKTRTLLNRFSITGKLESELLKPDERQYVERETRAVMLFDSLAGRDPIRFRDALGVIVKRSSSQ